MADSLHQSNSSELTIPFTENKFSRAMKTSFSMSSLRDGISPDQEVSGVVPATLPRRKHQEKRRRLRTSQPNDEFWAAIQSNYEYLMDRDLIETCKEASGELSWDDEDVPSTNIWTLEEFVARQEEMCQIAEHLEAEVTRPEGVQPHHVDAIKSLSCDRMPLDEQCQRLLHTYPDMFDDIHQRMDRLSGLLDTLQHRIAPVESRTALQKEIACQMRLLCKWIHGVEEKLGPLPRNPEWTPVDIQTKLSQHVILQKEIESRGKSVLTVIKLCERFHRCCNKEPGASSKDGAHLVRFASNFERRFHSLWLRSLEWQCWLEQRLVGEASLARGRVRDCDSDSDGGSEEPYKKYPRLNVGVGTPLGMSECPSSRRRSVGDTVEPGVMVGRGRAAAARPQDHQDVGYSSESSAHLSNEEGGGEFSRVYTYTSAEATSPRVLEVVMEGDCRPRKTPPREMSLDERDWEGAGKEPLISPAGPNCATFYFCHEDSDGDRRSTGRLRLNFGRYPRDADVREARRREGVDSLDPSDLEDYDGVERDEPEWSRCPDGIHELVNEAERLVRRPSLDVATARGRSLGERAGSRLVDSSCDASGECTSSNESDADSSSSGSLNSSSSQEQKRSVIDLKANADVSAPGCDAASCGSDPGILGVKMRTKKRKNGDRPWSVVELKQAASGLDLTQLSNSETALHRLAPNSSIQTQELACVCATSGDSSPGPRRPRKSNARRRSIRRGDAGSDGKCRSMGSLRHSSSSENGRWRSVASSDLCGCENESMEAECVCMESDDNDVTLLKSPDPPEFTRTGDDPSSSSEPVWDDYQDLCYQSEPYSEPGVDEAEAQRVWGFGDDYRNYIGSQSDGASTPSFLASPKSRQKQMSVKSSGNSRHHEESPVLDSESDLDDINELVEKMMRQLRPTEQELREHWQGDPSAPGRPNRIGEVLATCQTHIDCLRKVWGQLGSVRRFPSHFNSSILQTGETLRGKWEGLLMEAKEEEVKLGHLAKLKKEVEEFRRKVENVFKVTEGVTDCVRDHGSLKPVLDDLLAQQSSLLKVKQALVDLNFRINNFVTRTGVEVSYLKDQVVALYRLWDEARDGIKRKVDWLRLVEETWKEYSVECERLEVVFRADDGTLQQLVMALDDAPEGLAKCQLPIADISKIQLSELKEVFANGMVVEAEKYGSTKAECSSDARRGLEAAVCVARRLQELLDECPDAEILIREKVATMTEKAKNQQQDCQRLVLKMAALLEAKQPRLVSAIAARSRNGETEHERSRSSKSGNNGNTVGSKAKSRSSSLLWRVIRAALPIQLAVVILFCFACLLEPHCCESVNNLNLSLTPQLRYVRGPPPI